MAFGGLRRGAEVTRDVSTESDPFHNLTCPQLQPPLALRKHIITSQGRRKNILKGRNGVTPSIYLSAMQSLSNMFAISIQTKPNVVYVQSIRACRRARLARERKVGGEHLVPPQHRNEGNNNAGYYNHYGTFVGPLLMTPPMLYIKRGKAGTFSTPCSDGNGLRHP
jgi:hypothetical protein